MKTAYYNAQVYTGELPLRQAFVVENGLFLRTGSNEEMLAMLSDGDRREDLRGGFVCPGFPTLPSPKCGTRSQKMTWGL